MSTLSPDDYRKLANSVATISESAKRNIEAANAVSRGQEEKKQQDEQTLNETEYDKDLEREMDNKKWIDLASKGSNSILLHRVRSSSIAHWNDNEKRCNYWRSSLNKFNAHYSGFRFTYNDYSDVERFTKMRNEYPHCTLRITATPKVVFEPKPKVEVESKPKVWPKINPTFFSFLRQRLSSSDGFQSHFE